MKKLKFEKAIFIHSALDKESFVQFKNDSGSVAPEIVIAGKSNVGKSSLINHLLNQKLAFISSKPGKTKTINFYKIDDHLILLDFPGYGYAKESNALKDKWRKNLDLFLNNRTSIKLVLLLIDCRRELSSDDLLLNKWAKHKNIFCSLILTKCDKLKKEQLEKNIFNLQNHLAKEDCTPKFFIRYSTNDRAGRKKLISEINTLYGDLRWDL